MPDKWPLANGNWSSAANWNGGTLPVDGDDIYLDNRTIALDIDLNLPTATLRTTARSGGVVGGALNITTNRSVTLGQVITGNGTPITLSSVGITVNFNGITFIGSLIATNHAIGINAVGTYNFTNCTFLGGNAANRFGLNLAVSWGVINFTNCTATGGPGGLGINVQSSLSGTASGTLNVIQNASSTAGAIQINSGVWTLSGAVNHQGSPVTVGVAGNGSLQYTCTSQTFTLPITSAAQTGLWSFATASTNNTIDSPAITLPNTGVNSLVRWSGSGGSNGRVTYTGDIAMGPNAFNPFQFVAAATGTIRHVGTLTGPTAPIAAGVGYEGPQASTCRMILDRVAPGSSGFLPNLGSPRFETNAQLTVQTEAGTTHVIAATAALLDMPAPSNVRSGVNYNLGTQTGTCAVPPAGSVAFGVPVDATTGTAVLSGGGGGNITLRTGTAQAGASGSITLDAGASSVAGFYLGRSVVITSGAGAGQERAITAYNGTTKVATIWPPWSVNPNNTSVFAILPSVASVGDWTHQLPVPANIQELQADVVPINKLYNFLDNLSGNGELTPTSLEDGILTNAKIAANAIGATQLAQSAVDKIDAALLNAGDATDLIASIVARIGNTNIDQAALVVAIKAAFFDALSVNNKLSVASDGSLKVNEFKGAANTQVATITGYLDDVSGWTEQTVNDVTEMKKQTSLIVGLL